MFDVDDIDTTEPADHMTDESDGERIERYEGEEATEGVDAALDAFLARHQ